MKQICLDREFENLYCPITGQQVLQPDDYFPSPALDFIYLDEFECFQYMKPELMAKYPEHFEGNETIKGKKLLKKLRYDPVFSKDKLIIKYGNMSVARLCFDVGYEVEE